MTPYAARSRTTARCCSTWSPTPDEIAVPSKPTLEQGWGFAIAKAKEMVVSPE